MFPFNQLLTYINNYSCYQCDVFRIILNLNLDKNNAQCNFQKVIAYNMPLKRNENFLLPY